MSWPPRLAIGPFSTSARLGEVGCQRATVLSNTRSSSSHSSISRPRRRASLVVRCSVDPCSRPFALKLPIDRLPGSLWSSALFDRNTPEPAFPLERSGTSSIKVTHQNSLRGPPSGRWIMLLRIPLLQSRTRNTLHDQLCAWLAPCTQSSLSIRFRSSRPFFGEFEETESEVGRTDEFRGPRDAGTNLVRVCPLDSRSQTATAVRAVLGDGALSPCTALFP